MILKLLEVEHFAAKLIIELAQHQNIGIKFTTNYK